MIRNFLFRSFVGSIPGSVLLYVAFFAFGVTHPGPSGEAGLASCFLGLMMLIAPFIFAGVCLWFLISYGISYFLPYIGLILYIGLFLIFGPLFLIPCSMFYVVGLFMTISSYPLDITKLSSSATRSSSTDRALRYYIIKCKNKNLSEQTICERLNNQGWDHEQITKAMKGLS